MFIHFAACSHRCIFSFLLPYSIMYIYHNSLILAALDGHLGIWSGHFWRALKEPCCSNVPFLITLYTDRHSLLKYVLQLSTLTASSFMGLTCSCMSWFLLFPQLSSIATSASAIVTLNYFLLLFLCVFHFGYFLLLGLQVHFFFFSVVPHWQLFSSIVFFI